MSVPGLSFTEPVGAEGAPLLVLGPSLGTSTIVWERVSPLLAASFRVVAWDLPGHGASPVAAAPFSVAQLADAVVDIVADLSDEPVLYAGVSLGGATGLEVMLRHPSLVGAAAIIASGVRLGDPSSWRERAAQARLQSTSSLVTASASRWFTPQSIARDPELTGRLLHALQDADDESYAACCEALAEYDVEERLGEIAQPVLAVWGEFDRVAPEEKAQQIARGVQEGRALRIDGAAHLPPAEQPEALASALHTFFGTIGKEAG